MNSFLSSSLIPNSFSKSSTGSESDVLLNIANAGAPERDSASTSFKKALDVEASEQSKPKRREQPPERISNEKEPNTQDVAKHEPVEDVKSNEPDNNSDSGKRRENTDDDAVQERTDHQSSTVNNDEKESAGHAEGEREGEREGESVEHDSSELESGLVDKNESVPSGNTEFVLGQSTVSTDLKQGDSDSSSESGLNPTLTLDVDADNMSLPLEKGVSIDASTVVAPSGTHPVSAGLAKSVAPILANALGVQPSAKYMVPENIAPGNIAPGNIASGNITLGNPGLKPAAVTPSVAEMGNLNIDEASLGNVDENIESLKINTDRRSASSLISTQNLQGMNVGLNERAMALTNERIGSQSIQQWKGDLIENTKSIESAVKNAPLNPTAQFAQPLNSVAEARVQMPVVIRFGQPGWAGMVAERSAMMAAQNIKFAELQLDPPELGPLQVKVTVNQEHAQVSFVTANASVRDALDQTMPKLREMLEEQGLDLLDVDVSDQESQESEESDGEGDGQSSELLASGEERLDENEAISVVAEYGVDSYA